MKRRKYIKSVLGVFLVALFSFLPSMNAFATSNLFKIQNVEIVELSSSAEGSVSGFTDDNITSSVIFHELGDTAKYLITLKNTDSRAHTIESITNDSSNEYIEYLYDAIAGTRVEGGATISFTFTARYAVPLSNIDDRVEASNIKFIVKYFDFEDGAPLVPDTGDNFIMQAIGGASGGNVILLAIAATGIVATVVVLVGNRRKHAKIIGIVTVGVLATTVMVGALSKPKSTEAASLIAGEFQLKTVYFVPEDDTVNAIDITVSDEDIWRPAKTVTIDYNAHGDSVVGQYSIDNGESWQKYNDPFEISKNNTTIRARLSDGDNSSYFETKKDVSKIDPVTPTVAIDFGGTYYSGQEFDLSSVTRYTAGESGATVRWYIDDVELSNLSDTVKIDRQEEQYVAKIKAVATSGAGLSSSAYSDVTIIKYARWTDYLVDGVIGRNDVQTIQFVDWADMPDNPTGLIDNSVNQDGSVMEAYVLDAETGLYDIYIASPYGYSRYVLDSMGNNFIDNIAPLNHLSTADGGNMKCATGRLGLFSYLPNMRTIDFKRLDMFNITDMSCMFSHVDFLSNFWDTDSALESISWGDKFNTVNVVNMSYAFAGLENLRTLDLSAFDMSSVEQMAGMFALSESLVSLELSDWDTSNVVNMAYVFYDTPNLKDYDVSHWDTSNTEEIPGMFYRAGVETLNLSNWDVSKVKTFYQLFQSMPNLRYLNLSGWDTNNVVDMAYMFQLTTVPELDLTSFDTSNVQDMAFMFARMPNLTSLDLSSFDTSKVKNFEYMFYGSNKLKTIDFRHLDYSAANNLQHMYRETSALQNIFVEQAPVVKSGTNTSYMWWSSRLNNKYTLKDYGV